MRLGTAARTAATALIVVAGLWACDSGAASGAADLEGTWRIVSSLDSHGKPSASFARGLYTFDVSKKTLRVHGYPGWKIPYEVQKNGELRFKLPGGRLTVRPSISGDELTLRTVSWKEPSGSAPAPKTIVMKRVTIDRSHPVAWVESYYTHSRMYQWDQRMGAPLLVKKGVAPILLREMPKDLRKNILSTHLAFLDGEQSKALRYVARQTLSADKAAVIKILADRLWNGLGLTGQREIARLLGTAGSVPVDALVKVFEKDPDPVVLFALMMRTDHTEGLPPKYLLSAKEQVPVKVVSEWKAWLATEWPKQAKESLIVRRRRAINDAEAAIKSSNAKTAKDGLLRLACLASESFAEFQEVIAEKVHKGYLALELGAEDTYPGGTFRYTN